MSQPTAISIRRIPNIRCLLRRVTRKLFYRQIWVYYPLNPKTHAPFDDKFDTYMSRLNGWFGCGTSMCGQRMRDHSLWVLRPLVGPMIGQISRHLPEGGYIRVR